MTTIDTKRWREPSRKGRLTIRRKNSRSQNGDHRNYYITQDVFLPKMNPNQYTQNPLEVNLTIVGFKVRHDHKWGYHNPTNFY
jgi:hypothetical protein